MVQMIFANIQKTLYTFQNGAFPENIYIPYAGILLHSQAIHAEIRSGVLSPWFHPLYWH